MSCTVLKGCVFQGSMGDYTAVEAIITNLKINLLEVLCIGGFDFYISFIRVTEKLYGKNVISLL